MMFKRFELMDAEIQGKGRKPDMMLNFMDLG